MDTVGFHAYCVHVKPRSLAIMNLHIPTMFVMILIATTIMAISLGVISIRRRPDLRNWSLSLSLQVLAYGLFSLRGQISDWWSIVGANTFVTASVALYAAGLCRFHHRSYHWLLLATPVAVCLVGFGVWIDDYRTRVIFGSMLWLIQGLHLLALMVAFHPKTVGRGQYILGMAVLIFVGTQVYRLLSVFTGMDQSVQITDVTPLAVVTYFSSLTSTLLLSVGALTMVQER